MRPDLPNYEGGLKPSSWSSLKLPEAVRTALKAEALPGCRTCRGDGCIPVLDQTDRYEICPCTTRPK